jgi:signal transduction histidine kinase
MIRTLKARLNFGAGLLALFALLAAGLQVFGMERARVNLDTAIAAERRISELTALSAQMASYGLQAVAAAQAGAGADREQLEAQEERIRESFARLDSKYAQAMARLPAEGPGAPATMAARVQRVAQVRAGFDDLVVAIGRAPSPEAMQTTLGYASTQIGPILNRTLEEEFGQRAAVFDAIDRLRLWMMRAAIAISVLALVAFAVFRAVVLRPILRRLTALAGAVGSLAKGDLAPALPDSRDEFAPLIAETRHLAAKLANERQAVDRDRAHLNQIVEERTESLRIANRRLAEVDADRKRFFADVSHELRTPLTVILSEVDLARRSPENFAATFAVIGRRARQLTRRIEDLLRLARSTDGRLEFSRQNLDLRGMIEAIPEEFGGRAEALGLRIEIDCAGTATAHVDPDWTRQIVAGLVDNALRHAAQGRIVRILTRCENHRAMVEIVDNGPGMENPDALFERFERGPKSHGFGIGLAFARWVTEEQGGRITLECPVSAPHALGRNPGTRLILSFPEATA